VSLLLLIACAGGADSAEPDTAGSTCWGDLPAGEVATFAEGFSTGTEGIAFSGGALYVSFLSGVAEVDPSGAVGASIALDHALGLAPAVGGVLVADPGEFTLDGSGDDGHLRFVDDAGGVTDLAAGMPNPNFVTATAWGDVLVSDDTGDIIYAVNGDGVVRSWLDSVPSPNGMAFSPAGDALYVVSTFTSDPPLWRVPVNSAGVPGTPEVLVTFVTASAPDGLTVDAAGNPWVAVNLAGELVRVDPATGDATTFASDLPTPASLAFGTGPDFDPCSLYVTSLYGDTVSRVSTGTTGLTLPDAQAVE